MELLAEVAQAALESISGKRCENCGFGYRHEDKTGLRLWCKRCIDVYYRRENLTEAVMEKTIFDTAKSLYYGATIEALDPEIQAKLSELQPGQDLFITGEVGTGKTFAMSALIRKYIYEGYHCERINFDDLCVQIRSSFSKAAKKTEEEVIEPLLKADRLFIDDLGLRSKQETDFAYVTFYSLLNNRQMDVLPTIISSNKTIEQLGQTFDWRVASRLQTALIIEFKGEDRRGKS